MKRTVQNFTGLWRRSAATLLAMLLLAAAPALAQDAATDAAPEASGEAITIPQIDETLEGVDDSAVVTGEGETSSASATADELDAQRQVMIEAIREEMSLPAQSDTGIMAPNVWMPEAASEHAEDVDFLFWFVMWITVFFTVLLTALMVWFAIYYRHREGDPDPEGAPTHSTTLEITWTVIPTCIVLVMFVMGFKGFLDTTVAPQNAYEIRVVGSMWNWSFTYPNGAITSDLHLPKDRPVRFILQSQDVIHSLYIPAFRLKKDVVPGRFNEFWVTPSKEGIYEVYCAEYCGTNHSQMQALAFVYPQDRYDEMLAKISNIYVDFATGAEVPPAEVGQKLWLNRGCSGCHSVDGSTLNAPTWQGLWGSQRPFLDGSSAVADESYIRESILYPQRHIVQGWGNAMPSYLGQLSDRDIDSIIAYLQTLSDNAKQLQGGGIVTPEESQSLPEDAEQTPQ